MYIKENKNKYRYKKERTDASMKTAFQQKDNKIFRKNLKLLAKR